MKKVRKYLSYSNLMASFAVFLAMGGAAFAVQQAQKNSVTSASIKNSTVTGKDVKDESLTGADVDESTLAPQGTRGPAGGDLTGSYPNPLIRPDAVGNKEIANGAVTGVKLGLSSVDSSKIQDDSVGAPEIGSNAVDRDEIAGGAVTGAKLATSAVGSAEIAPDSVGASELKGMTAVVGEGVGVSSGTAQTATVKCPGQTQLIGGGYAWLQDEANSMIANAPSEADPNQTWEVRGMVAAGSNTLFAWANCMAI